MTTVIWILCLGDKLRLSVSVVTSQMTFTETCWAISVRIVTPLPIGFVPDGSIIRLVGLCAEHIVWQSARIVMPMVTQPPQPLAKVAIYMRQPKKSLHIIQRFFRNVNFAIVLTIGICLATRMEVANEVCLPLGFLCGV